MAETVRSVMLEVIIDTTKTTHRRILEVDSPDQLPAALRAVLEELGFTDAEEQLP